MAKAETKSELSEIIDGLECRIGSMEGDAKYARRELANARRLFMELYDDHRTLKLRFGWLEEAATDVVTSCDDHRQGMIEGLADNLGIELKQEK